MSEHSDGGLDLREQIARIDRHLAESDKFRSETQKLIAEANKLRIDRWLAPALAIAATIGALLGVAAFIARVIG